MFNKGLGNIYKQAQKMQKKMAEVQDELKNIKIDAQSGGGMVEVIVNGKKDILSIKINEEILNEDKEMIEDLILSAMNQAMQNAEKKANELMKSATGGSFPNFNLPGF